MRQAAELVCSDIHHTRHGQPSHFLARKGLSVLVDLDRLEEASQQTGLFSIDRFNLISLHQSDFGPNHKSQRAGKAPLQPLASWVRQLAAEALPGVEIKSVQMLAMPRILGIGFNPITVYCAADKTGQTRLIVYEVHNTFGDAHSYLGLLGPDGKGQLHRAEKKLFVSPFFPVDGGYLLHLRRDEKRLNLLVRYCRDGKPALTATLRGQISKLTNRSILASLSLYGHWPMRVWVSIHTEALRLFWKKCRFYRRPAPPGLPVSKAVSTGEQAGNV